jgi:hypothetical protein
MPAISSIRFPLFIDANLIEILHNIGIHKNKEENNAITSL